MWAINGRAARIMRVSIEDFRAQILEGRACRLTWLIGTRILRPNQLNVSGQDIETRRTSGGFDPFRLRPQNVDLKRMNEAGKVETAFDSLGFVADS
jgi:hypothetical protein